MTIKEVLENVVFEYPKVNQDSFKGHSFASYFRNTIPGLLESSFHLDDIYKVKASAGNGAWAKVPWIAIFNRLVTESVTSGFYCVYLFCVDCSGVYLSLNQGIADKRNQYGLGVSREMLRDNAKYLRELLGEKVFEDFSDPLNLKLEHIPKETTTRRLGLAYEAGNIGSKYYPASEIPDNETLKKHFSKLIDIYFNLFEKFTLDDYSQTLNETQDKWFEDPRKQSLHQVTERNRSLSARVKKLQGYTCKACGFNFENIYGDIGKGFIEAHHLIPISNLEKAKIKLDPIQDFTVLCSNCHRMIHRMKPVPSLKDFQERVLRRNIIPR